VRAARAEHTQPCSSRAAAACRGDGAAHRCRSALAGRNVQRHESGVVGGVDVCSGGEETLDLLRGARRSARGVGEKVQRRPPSRGMQNTHRHTHTHNFNRRGGRAALRSHRPARRRRPRPSAAPSTPWPGSVLPTGSRSSRRHGGSQHQELYHRFSSLVYRLHVHGVVRRGDPLQNDRGFTAPNTRTRPCRPHRTRAS
jgi:hypothetical protein